MRFFAPPPHPRLLGTAGCAVPTLTNEQVVRAFSPRKRGGEPITPEWIERRLGIRGHALDMDPVTLEKRPRERGGLYDGDLVVRAVRDALADADLDPRAVDVLVHVSTTPDYLFMHEHMQFIVNELGLREDLHCVHLNLGCAGLGPALRIAWSDLNALGGDGVAVVVASQCCSAFGHGERATAFQAFQAATLGPLIFGDGAGAVVLGARRGEQVARGFVGVCTGTVPGMSLVSFPGGGGVSPTTAHNVQEHCFQLDTAAIKASYVDSVRRAFDVIVKNWQSSIAPIVGGSFDLDRVRRFYLHQANLRLVEAAADALGVGMERVPTNVDRLGNLSAASTLLLLNDDLRAGALQSGDLAIFAWVGAGGGAQWGGAVFRA